MHYSGANDVSYVIYTFVIQPFNMRKDELVFLTDAKYKFVMFGTRDRSCSIFRNECCI